MLNRCKQFIVLVLCAALLGAGTDLAQAASWLYAPGSKAGSVYAALNPRISIWEPNTQALSASSLVAVDPVLSKHAYVSTLDRSYVEGARGVTHIGTLLFAALFGTIAFEALKNSWSIGHLSSFGLMEASAILAGSYLIQSAAIILLKDWTWFVKSGQFRKLLLLARRQPYFLFPRELRRFPLIADIQNLPAAENVSFLAVKDGLQYINANLKVSLSYFPPWLQYIASVPIRFFRDRHERPAHFTSLNRLPGFLNDPFIAYPMVSLSFLLAVAAYAWTGDWVAPTVAAVVGGAIRSGLSRWGAAREREELAINRAIERMQRRLSETVPFSTDDVMQIRKAAQTMHDMLPKHDRPSMAYIIDQIDSTNLTDPDRGLVERALPGLVINRHLLSNTIETSHEEIPPTFVFNPKVYASYEGTPPKLIALTVDGDFAALTSVTSQAKEIKDVMGKGGVRWYQVGMDRLKSFKKKLRSMLPEDVRLAETMGDKNPWSEVFFDGGKTVILAKKKANKLSVIRRWASSSILAGVLLNTYIAGPDMNMGEEEMAEIANAAYFIQQVLPQRFPRRTLATTSRSKETGSYPHYEWTVTSTSAIETLLALLEDDELCEELKVDREHITVAIQGFGDVGSGIIQYLDDLNRLRPELRVWQRIKIVGVSDVSGSVYHEEGLQIEALLELRRLQEQRIKNKEKFQLVKEYKGPSQKFKKNGTAIFYKGATVIIPAANPNVFTTPLQVARLKQAGTKILVEGANNSVKRGLERLFHEREGIEIPAERLPLHLRIERWVARVPGMLRNLSFTSGPSGDVAVPVLATTREGKTLFYIPGAVANFGGVKTSTEEWLDVMRADENWVIANMPARKAAVRSLLQTIARDNMRQLLLWHKETGRSVHELQQMAVSRMRQRRSALLDELNHSNASQPLKMRVKELAAEGLPDKVARMIAATEIARKEVFDTFLTSPAPASVDVSPDDAYFESLAYARTMALHVVQDVAEAARAFAPLLQGLHVLPSTERQLMAAVAREVDGLERITAYPGVRKALELALRKTLSLGHPEYGTVEIEVVDDPRMIPNEKNGFLGILYPPKQNQPARFVVHESLISSLSIQPEMIERVVQHENMELNGMSHEQALGRDSRLREFVSTILSRWSLEATTRGTPWQVQSRWGRQENNRLRNTKRIRRAA